MGHPNLHSTLTERNLYNSHKLLFVHMKIIFTNKVPSLGGLFEIYFYFSVFSFYQKSIKIMVANPGGWGGALPYLAYTGLCWSTQYCFQGLESHTGCTNPPLSALNRVSFWTRRSVKVGDEWSTFLLPTIFSQQSYFMKFSLRRQMTFCDATIGFPVKLRLGNKSRNSILMMRHTTQIWVVLLNGRGAWEIWFNQSEALFPWVALRAANPQITTLWVYL